MIRVPPNFYNRVRAGDKPVIYTLIITAKGSRVYAQDDMTGVFDEGGYIEKEGRLKTISGLGRSVESVSRDVIDNLQSIERNTFTAVYDNSDYHFSKLIPYEAFISKMLYVYIGYEQNVTADHVLLLTGKIIETEITADEFAVTAEEK
ncbi:MAG: hypothetical protein V1709_11510 [Planctomycetota bacterium]